MPNYSMIFAPYDRILRLFLVHSEPGFECSKYMTRQHKLRN